MYTIIGQLKELQPIVTKKAAMAFAKLEDMEGEVDHLFPEGLGTAPPPPGQRTGSGHLRQG